MDSGSIAVQQAPWALPGSEAERASRKLTDLRRIIAAFIVIALCVGSAALLFFGIIGSPGATLTPPARASLTASSARPASLAKAPIPDPLIFAPIAPDRARLLNAKIPFADSVGRAAKPFTFVGDVESRERAIDCLASAMWYEAGDDTRGQRAVGQVVLNRVRHPAFPSNVCGVVFQGSERQTGCQFTFTCDGALQRLPSDTAFARARSEARAMLAGKVDAEVGAATHYHTDWVHPVWSAAMDKLTKVDTHLFFRWRGKWGGASALAQRYGGTEPAIPKLARISPIHRSALPAELAAALPESILDQSAAGALAQPVALSIAAAAPKPSDGLQLSMAPGGSAGAPALKALEMCGDKSFCKVVGTLPTSAAPAFLYIRDRRTGVERTYWDCGTFPRKDAAQCLSAGNRWLGFEGNLQSGGA
jgi:spore germination cell wall hydrolase CwlJ-like protein